jgi:zinc protease
VWARDPAPFLELCRRGKTLKNSPLKGLASFFLALLGVIFCFVRVSAQSGPATKAPSTAGVSPSTKIPIPDIPYTEFVLDNGLTVVVHEDHKAPIVAVNSWYHVGSKNEKPGRTGFAHLFEHLMFSGSENFNYTYINAMERIGATDLNGTTNPDRTNYFEDVPTSMLDYVLFAESKGAGGYTR